LATLPPPGDISFAVAAGEPLRLTQPEGERVADLISFNRDELTSMRSSRAINLSWKLTAPHLLYSNRLREMWQVEDDLTGENYCGGYGEPKKMLTDSMLYYDPRYFEAAKRKRAQARRAKIRL